MMDWRDAVVEWCPDTMEVEVYHGSRQDRGRSYVMGGAYFPHLQNLDRDDPAVIFDIFIQMHTIVVRDGLDAQEAHKQFLKIDQYRERISPDCDGADQDGPPNVKWGIVK